MRKAYEPNVVRPKVRAEVVRPLAEFLQSEANSGLLLMACAIAALVWANSPWSENYFSLWHTELRLGLGNAQTSVSLLHVVNDGLMALFFLLVGLEIKRELVIGELSSRRQAALPAIAALGGMIVPAAIYAALNFGTPGVRGWGVPMATDIAFSLGVLALVGSRVPYGLKVLLAAVAIVDDLGAVLVIALFYSSSIDFMGVGVMSVMLGVLALFNWMSVRQPMPYLLVGAMLWIATMRSGIHPTVAGVLLAFAIPTKVHIFPAEFSSRTRRALDSFDKSATSADRALMDEDRQVAVRSIERDCQRIQMPLERIEDALAPYVRYAIMPLFAFANAGIVLSLDSASSLGSGIGLGVVLGLVLGKPIGIFAFSFLAVKMGRATLPPRVRWRHMAGLGLVAGIGFTMSLFIAGLAFNDAEALRSAKLAIVVASVLAGTLGYLVLALARRLRFGRARGARQPQAAG